MPKVYDAVAVIRREGRETPVYLRCGAVFEKNGNLSLKLDTLPAGGEWNGWLSFYTPKSDDKPAPAAKPQRQAAPPAEFDDDVPF